MARMPTIVVPGVPLHLTQFGAARQSLFFGPQDCAAFLLDLGEAAAVFGCAVHAYVLMPARVQLLLTPAEPDGPARLMQALQRRCGRRADGCDGQSAQGRLTRAVAGTGVEGCAEIGARVACQTRSAAGPARATDGAVGDERLIRWATLHSDRDFLACCRHIELDPVRAGVVSEPIAYRWSSFRANGLGARDAILTSHPTYLALGATRSDRQRAYRALFEQRLDAEVDWCSSSMGCYR